MKCVDWRSVIEKNYGAIVDAMIRLDAKNRKYQVDLYLYPDGTTVEFENVGGNSCLNDDHFCVYSVNNEFNGEADEFTEEERLDVLNENRYFYVAVLDYKLSEV